MLTGKVSKVTLLSHIQDGLDYCSVIVDFDEVKIFGNYNDILQFIGKTVIYQTTMDIFRGESIVRCVNFYEAGVIQTVDKTSNVKLYSDVSKARAVVNFSVDDLRKGERETNCIAYLCGFEKGVSEYSAWCDCKMIDKFGKIFVVRLFDKTKGSGELEKEVGLMVGSYVQFHIENTRYGFQTSKLTYVNVPVVVAPEVEIAEAVIRDMVSGDLLLQSYMEKHNFIGELKNQIHYELGYRLVELAAELYEIENLCSISDIYDRQLLVRAAVTSRGYLLPCQTRYSKMLLNVNKVLTTDLKSDKSLIMLLDLFSGEDGHDVNKSAFYRIKKYCNVVLNERRGIYAEEESSWFSSPTVGIV